MKHLGHDFQRIVPLQKHGRTRPDVRGSRMNVTGLLENTCAFCSTPYAGSSCPKCGAFTHPAFNIADVIAFADELIGAMDESEAT